MEKFRCMSNRDKLDVSYTIKNDDIWQLINLNLGQEWLLKDAGTINDF